jgi:hypothetical protein
MQLTKDREIKPELPSFEPITRVSRPVLQQLTVGFSLHVTRVLNVSQLNETGYKLVTGSRTYVCKVP